MAPTLHLHAQGYPHDEALAVGDREGLVALRDALNEALESDEGYGVVVLVATATELRDAWLPYTDPDFRDPTRAARHPASLLLERLKRASQG